VAYIPTELTLGSGAGAGQEPEEIVGFAVSANYFSVLGADAALGRTFVPEDEQIPGAHPVVVLNHRVWERRFGADSSVLGKNVTLNGHNYTVVGVAPREFIGTIPIVPDV